MSTTAGVASQDYVAINLTAVTSLVLGVAGVLIVLSSMLLVLPIAAIFCGIIAMRQIGNSNGTQAGRGLAWLGITAALVVIGFFSIREYKEWETIRTETREVKQLVAELQNKLAKRDYTAIQSLFSDPLVTRKNAKGETFIQAWQNWNEKSPYGSIVSMDTVDHLALSPPAANGSQEARTKLVIHFTQSDVPGRVDMILRKEGGKWIIYHIPAIFPPAQPENAPPGMVR